MKINTINIFQRLVLGILIVLAIHFVAIISSFLMKIAIFVFAIIGIIWMLYVACKIRFKRRKNHE